MEKQNKNFKIKIVGIGDYGIRFIESLGKMPNVDYININTDWEVMGKSENQKLIKENNSIYTYVMLAFANCLFLKRT